MHAEDLSVIIPTRERWGILRRTLDGLAAQTAPGFETIVVLDGEDQVPPAELGLEDAGVHVLSQPHSGPGVARNLAAQHSRRPLLLLLGDDMVPVPGCIARHLEVHRDNPDPRTAVLGNIRWHPEVARGPLMHWLTFSDAQFDFAQLTREHATDAGWGRFYSSNVSLKRRLLLDAGGFDPDFRFDYEDLDLAWRLHQLGLRLLWQPAALTLHLHPHTLRTMQERYRSRASGERLMMAKHEWFQPWFESRLRWHAAHRRRGPWWPWLAQLAPRRPAHLRAALESQADRHYHQRLAPAFLEAWESARELEELRRYLGPTYNHERLVHHRRAVEREAATAADEAAFYRTGEAYLYDLTAFAMSGTKDPYRRVLTSLVRPGARVLDYGCGIGSDGLRLLEAGYRVEFAEYDNPSARYLRWRLGQRGLAAPVHDLDGEVPGGFDAAYAFDVIEHVDDPFAFLAELERRAELVVVNLLQGGDRHESLHRPLPIASILAHAADRGLLRHRRFHGRSHLIAYRGRGRATGAERWHGQALRHLGGRWG